MKHTNNLNKLIGLTLTVLSTFLLYQYIKHWYTSVVDPQYHAYGVWVRQMSNQFWYTSAVIIATVAFVFYIKKYKPSVLFVSTAISALVTILGILWILYVPFNLPGGALAIYLWLSAALVLAG